MANPTVPIVVMGVTGCGKTTIGHLLAQRLGLSYLEADDFHPAANVAKMHAGTPLTDEDRKPWLTAIAARIASETGPRPVVSCSALKRQYRDVLRQADPRVWFLHLVIDEAIAVQRVTARPEHFMPASLVASQFAAMEPLQAEAGLAVDATWPPQDIITAAVHQLIDDGHSGSPSSSSSVSSSAVALKARASRSQPSSSECSTTVVHRVIAASGSSAPS